MKKATFRGAIATVKPFRTGGLRAAPPARGSTPAPRPNSLFNCYTKINFSGSVRLAAAIALASLLSLAASASLPNPVSATSDSQPAALKLKERVSQNTSRQRPSSTVINAVRHDLSQRVGIPPGKLRVTKAMRRTWSNSCLGLAAVDEVCAQAQVEGWRIVLTDGRQTWAYRTDMQSRLRLETLSSGNKDLPNAVSDSVLQDAAQRLRRSIPSLKVVAAAAQTWRDGCLGLPKPTEFCTEALVPGWQVTVTTGQQLLIYRTNNFGSVVRLDQAASRFDQATLPDAVTRAVLRVASRRIGLPASKLQIVQFESIVTDGCLGLADPGEACTKTTLTGWQVFVEGGQQILVYHTDASGSIIRFNERASRIDRAGALESIPIAQGELPPELARNVIFRAIVSGGITAQTYETILLNDGRLIKVQVSTKNGQPWIRQISSDRVRQFQQLLEEQQFSRFDRLSYPADRGADYITVILSSHQGTTRYADSVQDRLPKALQQVIQTWNQIAL